MSTTKQERLDRRVQTVCLLIIASIAVGFALFFLKPVLVPFVLALFFTYCLTPIIDAQMTRFHMPRWLALTSTGITGVVILALFGFLIATAVSAMLRDLNDYRRRIDQQAIVAAPTTQPVATTTPAPSRWPAFSLDSLGIHRDSNGQLLEIPEDASIRLVSLFLSQTMETISSGALVILFMIFLLISHNPNGIRHKGLLGDIEIRAKRYISLMMLLSGAMGLFVALVLMALGVKYAGVFGLLAFVLNFIPSIGGIIATALPLPFILFNPEMPMLSKVLALAIPGGLQFIMGNILQPKIQGESLELHPVVVLMALIFFGMIWGIVGAFLATPITAVIKIVLERMPATRPLARLLAGDLRVLTEDWDVPPTREELRAERVHENVGSGSV